MRVEPVAQPGSLQRVQEASCQQNAKSAPKLRVFRYNQTATASMGCALQCAGLGGCKVAPHTETDQEVVS